MGQIVSFLIARLREPSTWAGLGTLVTGIGISIAPDLWKEITSVGLALGGLLAVLLPEQPPAA